MSERVEMFPIFLKLEGRRCLVVGAGKIATPKIASLLRAGAAVTAVAPEASAEAQEWAAAGRIAWVTREFKESDLDGVFLVVTGTDVQAVNHRVAVAARERNLLVNSVDDPPDCDFYYPSLVRRGDLQVAISTAGKSPALAQRLREEIDGLLEPELEQWLDELGLGILLLFVTGLLAGTLSLVLAASIILYNQAHKLVTASPWLMGICRFWVYFIAGIAGAADPDAMVGWAVWCGLALALYIVGLSYVARRESYRGPVPYWPLLLLAAPFFLAWLMDPADARPAGLWLASVLALWIARCVRPVFLSGTVNVGRVVSGLLAGIVFVDWLAVAPQCPRGLSLAFLALFGATQALQRYIPAT